jgi:hypothetical protein
MTNIIGVYKGDNITIKRGYTGIPIFSSLATTAVHQNRQGETVRREGVRQIRNSGRTGGDHHVVGLPYLRL